MDFLRLFSRLANSSYGTFSGKIIAIENSIRKRFVLKRLLPKIKLKKRWPPNMKIGTGASGIAILNDVPIWYEIWRNINGFPPDYYQVNTQRMRKNEIYCLFFFSRLILFRSRFYCFEL